jgi:hypothetical protein
MRCDKIDTLIFGSNLVMGPSGRGGIELGEVGEEDRLEHQVRSVLDNLAGISFGEKSRLHE